MDQNIPTEDDLRARAAAMGDNPYIDQAEYLRNFDRPDLAHYKAPRAQGGTK